MGSGQPSDKGLGEEGGWALGVSDPTNALRGGTATSPFQGVAWVTAGGGTHGDTLFRSTTAHSSVSGLGPCAELGDVVQQKVPFQQGLEAVSRMDVAYPIPDPSGFHIPEFSLAGNRTVMSCSRLACALLPL